MKIVADSKDFAKAFSSAAKAAHKESGVFTNVLIEAMEGMPGVVSFTGSRGAVLSVTVSIEADVMEPGEAMVPAGSLSLVTPLGKVDDECSAEISEGGLSVEFKGRSVVLPITSGDYPELPGGEYEKTITLDSAGIAQAASALSRADGMDKTLPLSGVFVSGEGKCLSGATRISAFVAGEFSEDGITLASEGLSEALRFAKASKVDEITASIKGGGVRYDIGENSTVFGSVFNEGWPVKFIPNAFAKECPTTVTVDKEELVDLLSHCNGLHETAAKSDTALYPVKMLVEDGKISLSIKSPKGSLSGEVDAKIEGDKVVRGLSGNHLMKTVSGLSGDTITLELPTDVSVPLCRIRGEDKKETAFLAFVRITEDNEQEESSA